MGAQFVIIEVHLYYGRPAARKRERQGMVNNRIRSGSSPLERWWCQSERHRETRHGQHLRPLRRIALCLSRRGGRVLRDSLSGSAYMVPRRVGSKQVGSFSQDTCQHSAISMGFPTKQTSPWYKTCADLSTIAGLSPHSGLRKFFWSVSDKELVRISVG